MLHFFQLHDFLHVGFDWMEGAKLNHLCIIDTVCSLHICSWSWRISTDNLTLHWHTCVLFCPVLCFFYTTMFYMFLMCHWIPVLLFETFIADSSLCFALMELYLVFEHWGNFTIFITLNSASNDDIIIYNLSCQK